MKDKIRLLIRRTILWACPELTSLTARPPDVHAPRLEAVTIPGGHAHREKRGSGVPGGHAVLVFLLCTAFALISFAPAARAQQGGQTSSTPPLAGTVNPTGGCGAGSLYVNTVNGNFYDCKGGNWNLITGGGGGSGCVPSGTSGQFLTDSGSGSCNDFGGFAASTNEFLTGLTSAGAFTQARPTCENLSDSGGGCNMSTTAGGDLSGTLPSPTVTNGSHITNSSIPNAGLVNTGTTVNSQTCTLGSSCTVTADLPATPSQCSTNQVATGIAANGNANCTSFGGGEVTYTSNQTLSSSNANQLVVMNCASSCTATLPATPPSAVWGVAIQAAEAGSAVTISPNGLNLNGGSSSLTIPVQGETVFVTTDGSNYFSQYPLIPSTNITMTPGASGISISAAGGSGGTPGGSSGQIQYNNSSAFGGFTMAGDCTITVPNITCTKTSGTAFAASATTDTTNAANISSGTLANARLAGSGSATVNGQTCTLGSSCTVSGAENTQTTSYTLVAGDLGKLVVMNCSSSCTVTLYGSPTNGYYGAIESIGSTVATVSLNSKNMNGSSSVPVLISYDPLVFWSDGTNYFGGLEPVVGTGITFTPAANGLTIALTNTATTVNGQTCTLGSTCTIPVQTNGTGNISQAGVNFITSTTNADGLTATPTNSATNVEKMEITGNYSGSLASATGLPCGATPALTGVVTTSAGSCATSYAVANTTFTNATTAVSGNSCSAAATTVTMTGLTTSMVLMITPSSDTSGSTGWGTTGGLVIDAWPSAANTLSYKICNQTSSSITPGAITWNVAAR